MTIIGWMLSRMILMRFLAFLIGITGFVITLQVFTLVDDILRVVENDLCVDPTQRFALGFSYGAAMSYALACARPKDPLRQPPPSEISDPRGPLRGRQIDPSKQRVVS